MISAENSLNTSQALERVMRQVISMQRADDVTKLVETLWEELKGLGYDFLSCALSEFLYCNFSKYPKVRVGKRGWRP